MAPDRMKRILVVDDDKDLVELVKLGLETKGYKVKSINNGEEVNQAIQDFSPDLILLDIFLGDNNGIDICNELKANPHTKDIEIIILSSRGIRDQVLSECPANDFIAKPFHIQSLHSTIQEHTK